METWGDFIGIIQSVEFSGRPFDHKPGFYVTDVEGLNGGGEVSSNPIARTGGPGALYTPGRREDERTIVITGFAWADTQGRLKALRDQFTSIMSEGDEFETFTFRELGEWRHVTVARKGGWPFDRRKRTGQARFQMSLRAPDQRIYGDAMKTTGWGSSVTVTNRGSHPAPVEIAVRGSRAGYTITGPRGAQVVVTRALAAGSPHSYDGDEGILSVAGAAQTTGVTRSDRIEIPRGKHTVSVSTPAEILVSGFDTFIP